MNPFDSKAKILWGAALVATLVVSAVVIHLTRGSIVPAVLVVLLTAVVAMRFSALATYRHLMARAAEERDRLQAERAQGHEARAARGRKITASDAESLLTA